jgi:hypothetical protein
MNYDTIRSGRKPGSERFCLIVWRRKGAVKKSSDAMPDLKFIIVVTIVAIAMISLSLAMGIPPSEEAPILHTAP